MLTRMSMSLPATRILIRPSCGPAFLGDVDEAHDLDTADHGPEQPPRGAVAFHQDTVDPVADAHAVGERLDMDVAGTHGHRFLDDQVHQLDDRRVPFFERVGDRRFAAARPASSEKSIAVSVNSWSIESTDSVSDVALP